MRILSLIKNTVGGRHAWYEAQHRGVTFKIRKELGVVKGFSAPESEQVPYRPAPAKRTFVQKVRDWFGDAFDKVAESYGVDNVKGHSSIQ